MTVVMVVNIKPHLSFIFLYLFGLVGRITTLHESNVSRASTELHGNLALDHIQMARRLGEASFVTPSLSPLSLLANHFFGPATTIRSSWT